MGRSGSRDYEEQAVSSSLGRVLVDINTAIDVTVACYNLKCLHG